LIGWAQRSRAGGRESWENRVGEPDKLSKESEPTEGNTE
jgi:hypothetical protein